MVRNPGVKMFERSVAGLQGERRAVLRPASRSLQKHDQLPRHGQCRRATEIVLDECQGEIDPGRDAGRRPDGTIPDEDRVGFDPHRRMAARQFAALPVRHDASAIEEPGLGQQKSTAAHRGGSPRRLRLSTQPSDEDAIGRCRVHSVTSGDEERVDHRGGIGEGFGRECQPGRGPHPLRLFRDHDGIVGEPPRRDIVRGREDLERPGDVEKLDRGIGQDLDPARRFWRKRGWDGVIAKLCLAKVGASTQETTMPSTLVTGFLVLPDIQQLDLTGSFGIIRCW